MEQRNNKAPDIDLARTASDGSVDAEWELVKTRLERFEVSGDYIEHAELEAWAKSLAIRQET